MKCANITKTAAPALAAVALGVSLAAPSAAFAAVNSKPLPCHASMSNSSPADYTTTTVRVKTNASAKVTTVAHYRTLNREHHGRANAAGRAGIPYYISGATPGYQVVVDVSVKWPHRSGSCETSFTPHA
jgi:hypothetical protein